MKSWSQAHRRPGHRWLFVRSYRWLLTLLLLALLGLPQAPARAQSTPSGGFDEGMGASAPVRVMALQADGNILIGGVFEVGGNTGIARLLRDGARDTTFQAVAGGTVHAIAVQPDGKILVGGSFQHMNGQRLGGLARLNPDGTLDDTFVARVGGAVFGIVQQPDGKILISGMFSEVNAQSLKNVARLHADGTLDTTFDANWGPSGGWVETIALQRDGKVLIGGHFDVINQQPRSNFARLHPNGNLDTNFTPGANRDGVVHSIVVQPDAKIIVGGSFTTFGDDGDANNIFRLFADGTSDLWFNYVAHANAPVHRIVLQENGDILLGGAFTLFQGQPRNHIVRTNSTGGAYNDKTFAASVNGDVNTIVVQPNGRILIGGAFTEVNQTPRRYTARLRHDGSLQNSWVPDPFFNYKCCDDLYTGEIAGILQLPDGKILIGGDFITVERELHAHLARLNPDGSIDPTFELRGVDAPVQAIALLSDGKILIGGMFSTVDRLPGYSNLARLNPDGSLDKAFRPGTDVDARIERIVVQPDGKILIGGWRYDRDSTTFRFYIARLNVDGSLDTSFKPGIGEREDYSFIYAMALQPDGKILIGGAFARIHGQARKNLARLNADGTLDMNFKSDVADLIKDIVVQPDGKVLISIGEWTNRIARLNPDGSLDPTFSQQQMNSFATDIALREDGKILIVGRFTRVGGQQHHNIALLRADGSVDPTQISLMYGVDLLYRIVEQADGNILISGIFSQYGDRRSFVGRLHNPDR
jgi:uncharacterized delta-60 repeat protein